MSVKQAYDFPLPGFWSNHAVAEYVCDLDGRRYLLRQLDQFMLFRLAERNCVEHTFFVPYRRSALRGKPGVSIRDGSSVPPLRQALTPPIYSQKMFAEQIANGEHGRVALYSCPEARDCSPLLFFRQDGTGFFPDFHTANGYSAHEPTEQVDFVWHENAQGIAVGADILTADWPQMEALCREVFIGQVWPRMKDPFVSFADTPDAPLVWKCGSQQELFHITHCIFHTHPGEWTALEAHVNQPWLTQNHCISVIYEAEMQQRAGGVPTKHWPKRIRALCHLAFQHNTFTGYKWEYHRYEGRTRRQGYKAKPLGQGCSIAPPSAHERAEALLTLWDWLEDKVTEEQRRAYLGVE